MVTGRSLSKPKKAIWSVRKFSNLVGLDADGRPDLFVANDFRDPDFYLKINKVVSKTSLNGSPTHGLVLNGTDSNDLDGDADLT